MNGKNNMNGLAGGLLVLGVILVIGLIAGAGGSSANTCIKSGCNNTRTSGSSYCYIHKPYTGSSTRSSGSSSKTYSQEQEVVRLQGQQVIRIKQAAILVEVLPEEHQELRQQGLTTR